jgi:hypothetical protein
MNDVCHKSGIAEQLENLPLNPPKPPMMTSGNFVIWAEFWSFCVGIVGT